MIYLHRYATTDAGAIDIQIAVVEAPDKAEKYLAQGYERCTRAELREDWRQRDATTLYRMRVLAQRAWRAKQSEMQTAPLGAKVVGGHIQ